MPQHDLLIDNGSGAAVRADLNGALAALGSCMKGPNAPPAPVAGMIWLDDDTPSTTVWTVKQYDGADWIELGRLDITANMYIPSEGVIAWADVASAATVDLGAQASRSLRLTGTTGITSFGTAASGVRKRLRIATGLTITHNATSLICPGAAGLVLAAGDIIDVESLGSGNWVVVDYQRAAGLPGINRGTEQLTQSVSQVDFTGIPAGVRRITLLFNNVSAGTGDYLIQLGDSGGIETSGYLGSSVATIVGATPAVFGSNISTGFLIESANAANTWVGAITFTAFSATTWIASGVIGRSTGGTNPIATVQIAGWKQLSDTLDRIRLSTATGTFDNGSINIFWEF